MWLAVFYALTVLLVGALAAQAQYYTNGNSNIYDRNSTIYGGNSGGNYTNNGNSLSPFGVTPSGAVGSNSLSPFGTPSGQVGSYPTGPRYLPAYPNAPRYGYNFYGQPVALPGNYYGINSGGTQYRFWQSPSGYYYPWASGVYGYAPPTIIYQQGTPEPAKPQLSTIFKDMQTMLDESKSKGKLNQGDYEHLDRRLHDLMRIDQSARSSGYGVVDSGQEADLRQQLDLLGVEISRRVRL